jgi:hypothetical protein
VIHYVSVNASMFTSWPPMRNPFPERPTPKRCDGFVGGGLVIDVDHADRDTFGKCQTLHDVPGQHGKPEPVIGSAGEPCGLVDVLKATTGATGRKISSWLARATTGTSASTVGAAARHANPSELAENLPATWGDEPISNIAASPRCERGPGVRRGKPGHPRASSRRYKGSTDPGHSIRPAP